MQFVSNHIVHLSIPARSDFNLHSDPGMVRGVNSDLPLAGPVGIDRNCQDGWLLASWVNVHALEERSYVIELIAPGLTPVRWFWLAKLQFLIAVHHPALSIIVS